MANLTSQIDFTAVFRTANRTLTLQNTGNYAGVFVTYSWVVSLEGMGVVRTATGISASIVLPAATDGGLPELVYTITAIVSDGIDDSQLTRSFAYSLAGQKAELSQFLDYTTPRLVYQDAQEYFQVGYNMPSVVREWSALRSGQTVPITSTSSVLDLAVAGAYYAGQYSVSLSVAATYTPADTSKQWVTVIATYTAADTLSPFVWPTLPQILGWVNEPAGGCGCGCEGDCKPVSLYGIFKDNYCNGNYEAAERNLQALYKSTHNGQRYKPSQDGGLLVAVNICGTTPIPLPNILSLQQSPTSQTVEEDDTVTFMTVATATTGLLAYQWQVSTDGVNFTNISGANAASYSFAAQLAQDGNNYRCIITGTGTTPASVTTNNAGLTVTAAGLQAPSNLRLQRSGNTVKATWDGHTLDEDYAVVISTNPDFTVTSAAGYSANTTNQGGGAGTFTYEWTQRTIGTAYFVGIVARETGLANSTRTTGTVTTFNRILSIGGATIDNDLTLAGAPTLKLHLNTVANPVSPDNSQNNFIIAGTNRGNAAFQNDHVGQDIALEYAGVIYYGPDATEQYKFLNGQPANINIS